MKRRLMIVFALAALAASAIPLKWQVETTRISPATFEAYHGERLELDAQLLEYGKSVRPRYEDVKIFYQTNGMGGVYWTAPASLSGDRMRAVITPDMDPGAAVLNGFIGCAGESYRAAFQIRFRPSPGAVPNALPLPAPVIDFATVEVVNAPWGSGGASAENVVVRVEDGHAVVDGEHVTAAEIVEMIRAGKSVVCQVEDDGTLILLQFAHSLDVSCVFSVPFALFGTSLITATVDADGAVEMRTIDIGGGGGGASGDFIPLAPDKVVTVDLTADEEKPGTVKITAWGGDVFEVNAEDMGVVKVSSQMTLDENARLEVDADAVVEVKGARSLLDYGITDAATKADLENVKPAGVNLHDAQFDRRWELSADGGVFTFTLIEEPAK